MVEENVLELFDELLSDADAAADASGVYTNAGKASVRIQPRAWEEGPEGRQLVDISVEKYRSMPMSASQKQLDVIIGVDIQELKPDLEFGYERTVSYRKKDWYDTLKPSVAMAFNLNGYAEVGADDRKKLLREMPDKTVMTALMGINGKYVFVSDVNSTTGRVARTSQKPIKTVRIDQVFNTRDAFEVAYKERFGQSAGVPESAPTDAPPGYSSMDTFASDVRDLRAEGMNDADIAAELSVSPQWVAKV